MSSIRSASSSTRIWTCDRFVVRCSTWSSNRPGVATSSSQPLRSAAICGFMSTPPNTTAQRSGVCFA